MEVCTQPEEITPETLCHDLTPITPEAIALQALIDFRLGLLTKETQDGKQ